MPDKKTLMTCDVKEFVASMSVKKETKRKVSPTQRSVKNHHKQSKS